jgi:hypothetical protein
MTDHLEAAADRAIELADVLLSDNPTLGSAAQHLTYLAGLVRGGAVQHSTYSPWWSDKRRSTPPDEPVRFYPSSGTHYEKVQEGEHRANAHLTSALAQARAHQNSAESELRAQRRAHTEAAKNLGTVVRQRGELLTAAQDLLAVDTPNNLAAMRQRLADVVERIETELR